MLRRIAVLATLAIHLSGCSLVALKGPLRLRPGAPLPARAECSTNMILPGIELAIASYWGVSLIEFEASRSGLSASERDLDGIFLLPAFAIFAVSGVSGLAGISKVQACRDFAEMLSLAADTTAQASARFIDPRVVADPPPRPRMFPLGGAAVGGCGPDSAELAVPARDVAPPVQNLAPPARNRCGNGFFRESP